MLVWIVDRLISLWPDGAWTTALAGFTKITVRTGLAALAGFVLAVLLGSRVIGWLKARFREPPCDRVPQLRTIAEQKAWTPTMGGLFLVAGIVAATALLGNWRNPYLPLLMFNLLGQAAIGAIDDLSKLRGVSRGLRPRGKLLAQFTLATVVALWLYAIQQSSPETLDVQIPIVSQPIHLGAWTIMLTALVIVASSNAVNLSDGLDGLAGGCLISSTAAIGAMAYFAGHADLARYLGVLHVADAGETVVVAGAMIGGTLGFLWFNCQPAQVFMGNVGALGLGGTLGLLAAIVRQEFLLAVVGGIFVAEATSVILQVASWRWRGQRVFRCAPLHHHFQLLGWAENKVVVRFWIVSALCGLLGLGALKMKSSDENGVSQQATLKQPAAERANLEPADRVF